MTNTFAYSFLPTLRHRLFTLFPFPETISLYDLLSSHTLVLSLTRYLVCAQLPALYSSLYIAVGSRCHSVVFVNLGFSLLPGEKPSPLYLNPQLTSDNSVFSLLVFHTSSPIYPARLLTP